MSKELGQIHFLAKDRVEVVLLRGFDPALPPDQASDSFERMWKRDIAPLKNTIYHVAEALAKEPGELPVVVPLSWLIGPESKDLPDASEAAADL